MASKYIYYETFYNSELGITKTTIDETKCLKIKKVGE